MRLSGTNESAYQFERIGLTFAEEHVTNLFALKNNKTLRETVEHPRYAKLRGEAYTNYGSELNRSLGEFLLNLKTRGDIFYKRFLNRYGDDTYSVFSITSPIHHRARGIYAYVAKDQILYIGRCRDALSKRINQGYGKIHPKNCYLDGQATNCHLNSRITKEGPVGLWLHRSDALDDIEMGERDLIRTHSPPWNLQHYA